LQLHTEAAVPAIGFREREAINFSGVSLSLQMKRIILAVAILATWLAFLAFPFSRNLGPRVHDPSTIIRCGDEYWFYTTGMGIPSWHSTDLLHWVAGPRVFNRNYPRWIGNVVRGQRGYFWAPDVIHDGGQYWMYYAVSRFGQRTSVIGLAVSPTLNPNDPQYNWTDRGIVVQTTNADRYNAIDPSILVDKDGRMWMSFGSFWTGIKLVELDRTTKLRKANARIIPVASAKEIEASYLYAHGGYYYLLVNWGLCCKGVNSTYNVRVGRATSIAGPYLDKSGVDMRKGGGTLLLGNDGHLIGPGQTGIYDDGQHEWISFHYYNADDFGQATLGLRELDWGKDGWPVAGNYAR
jgi:arabinan endo-1,5-alpha-L-arabinosidase